MPLSAPITPAAEPGDLHAVDEVLGGNREMFEVIVRRYNPLLYRVGISHLRNHAQAEDAMQNAYVKAFLHLDRFQREAAFSTWLTRIMINECLMLLRRGRQSTGRTVELRELEAAAPDRPPADHLHAQEAKALLEKAIAALPRSYRTVYLLREVQHLSTAETAACLGLSSSGVKVKLHRARERLKTELLKSAAGVELFAYPAFYCDGMTARVLQAVRSIET